MGCKRFIKYTERLFQSVPRLKDKPIDSYIQVFMIVAWVIGLFSAFAIISVFHFGNS